MNLRCHVAKYWGRKTYIALNRCRSRALRLDAREQGSGSAARRQIGPGGLCQPLAAHGGAEADEAQRARHGDGNPACPERHIDAIQGDGPPHHNPDQLQKRDQGKDGGGKRASFLWSLPVSDGTRGRARPPQPKWGGAGAAATPPLSREVA